MEQRGSDYILAMKMIFFCKKNFPGGFFPVCSALPATCVSFFQFEKFQWLKISDEKNKKQVFSHFFGQKTVVFDFGWLHLLAKIGIHAWFRQSSSPPFTDGWVFPRVFRVGIDSSTALNIYDF